MANVSPLLVARHEAAHAVVGLKLGLKLVEARITPGEAWHGHCLWLGGERFALACMFGAGVVWDRLCHEGFSAADAELCRKHTTTNAAVGTCYKIAKEIIRNSRAAHGLVTRALLNADDYRLTGNDLKRILRGEDD